MSEQKRPVLPPLPTADQIPPQLRDMKHWCGWRAVWDESKQKYRKPSYSPVDGSRIGAVPKGSSDEDYTKHWLPFAEALEGAKENHLDGIGFVFVQGDGFVGIDFDDAVKDGVINPAVPNWLKWLPSYAEISPSGTGVHVICRGEVKKALTATPLPASDGATVEIYNKGRYFTFTGQAVPSAPLVIEDCQDRIDKLRQHLGNKDSADKAKDDAPHAMSASTARRLHKENLDTLRNSRQGEGNNNLNQAAFFAARAHTAGVLNQTEKELKDELLKVVTEEWKSPHPRQSAEQTIESGWNTGKAQPLAICEEKFPELTKTIEEFNKEFFIVENLGSHVRVCWEEQSSVVKDGQSLVLQHQSFSEFQKRFMHLKIKVGEKQEANEEGQMVSKPKLKSKGEAWLQHPDRRQYKKIVYMPEVQTPKDIFNLWHGFAFQPVRGDWSLYRQHVWENICAKDKEKYSYVMGWLANGVQNPNEPGYAALSIFGGQGTGKNIFSETYAKLYGQHALVATSNNRVTCNFNAHFRSLNVLVGDEAFFGDSASHANTLKSLITGTNLCIEGKGLDLEEIPNLLHLIIQGNSDVLVKIALDERRYCSLRCGDGKKENFEFFGALLKQMKNGGYAAMLYDLLKYDLSKFNVRKPPRTKELRNQMLESLEGINALWFSILYDGAIPAHLHNGTPFLRSESLMQWSKAQSRDTWEQLSAKRIGTYFGEEGLNLQRDREGTGYNKKPWHWVVPDLKEARALWMKKYGAYDWPNPDDHEWAECLEYEEKFTSPRASTAKPNSGWRAPEPEQDVA